MKKLKTVILFIVLVLALQCLPLNASASDSVIVLPPVPIGQSAPDYDVNEDDIVDIKDVLQIIKNKDIPAYIAKFDSDGDGAITQADIVKIINIILKSSK